MDQKSCLNFIDHVFELLKKENVIIAEDCPVVNFKHPAELMQELDLCLKSQVLNGKDFLETLKKIIKYSVKTNHSNFYNQLYGGVDLFGFGGVVLSECLNTNQYTYEVAPVFSLVEKEVITHFMGKVGYDKGDGIFCAGGSMANMYGLALARYALFPGIKEKGLLGVPKLIILSSEEGHYSVLKGANWMGVGTENVLRVKTTTNGKMSVADLENKILESKKRDEVPFVVNATAGTTVLGAIDPIAEISDVCKKYNIWLHVDACFGGSLLLSSEHKEKLQGIENADSLSWNPHKLLGAPLQCSIFLTKHPDILMKCNSSSAHYLFQPDKLYDVTYDSGDKSLQCGRKVDAFKLWTMWKVRGDDGFENLIDNAMDCTIYFKNQIQNKEGFRLINEDTDTTSICFFYIPPSLRNKEENEEWRRHLNSVAPTLKNVLLISGELMICHTALASKGLCNFFRLVVTCHPPRTTRNMDYVIELIENYGRNM